MSIEKKDELLRDYFNSLHGNGFKEINHFSLFNKLITAYVKNNPADHVTVSNCIITMEVISDLKGFLGNIQENIE